MARLKRIISDQEKDQICKDYLAGKSINKLQKETKLQHKNIQSILISNGIKMLTAYETQKRNASLEERNYFDDLNELQCYVLGAIFGDGCVHYNEQKYKYAVTITSNDTDILISSQKLFGVKFPIKKRKISNAYNIVVNSKHLCKELIDKFQLQSPKSNNLIWPSLPQEMIPCFISGLLSTDGCVELRKKYIGNPCAIEFSYSSNCLSFVESLQNFLTETLKINRTKIKINKTKRKNKNYSLRYSGSHAKIILDWIYNQTNSETQCKRKYDIYQKYLTSLVSQIQ